MPPPEQTFQQNVSEDFLLEQDASGDIQYPWDAISMELDQLRASMATQMDDPAAAAQMNGETEDYSLDFPTWSEPASSGSTR